MTIRIPINGPDFEAIEFAVGDVAAALSTMTDDRKKGAQAACRRAVRRFR